MDGDAAAVRTAPSGTGVALVGLIALAIAQGIGRFAFTPILPMMMHDDGVSVAGGGWLAAVNYLGYLAGSVSAMSPRARPRQAIHAGLVLIVITTIGMGLTHRFPAWVALRLLAGVGSAWVLIFVSAWCLQRLAVVGRPLLNGVVFAGVGSGIAVAGTTCLILMSANASAADAWLCLGGIALAATLGIWRPFGADHTQPIDGHRRLDIDRPAWNREWIRIVLCYGTFGFAYIIPATFLPVMARSAVADPRLFGWSWPIFGVAAALTPLAAALWSDRFGSRRVLALAQFVMAIGVIVPVFWPGLGGIVVAALLVGGTFMVATMAGLQEARVLGGGHATVLMAAVTTAFGLGQIVGPLAVSGLSGSDGNFSRPLLIAGASLVASAIALVPGPSRPRCYTSRHLEGSR